MEITWQETSPHRDRGQEMDYPWVGLGSQDLRFANHAASGSIPAQVWLANNVQVLRDITHSWTPDIPSYCYVPISIYKTLASCMSCHVQISTLTHLAYLTPA